ncbi:cytochrome b [Variovorax sp. PAMC26660]|uniref:cytochrome b n=1 Tax=Variovorax sp. PAMC26660 TaxID=2762322 RepID=UPI00164D1253|nr:cytochrome b/b6 domain-containing protein [Variovorax sp. PAMC26660]QNK67167.1 cytochrome b [Variovorax sp. PAMC26660]
MRKSPDQYDKLSKAFHWITATIVVTAFVLGPGDFGRIVDGGVDPATRNDIVWHESLGVAVFVLTFLRLIWVAVRPGAPRHQMPTWMLGLSRLVHFALWALLLSLPISALLALGSESHPLTLLGGMRINVFPFVRNSYFSNLADWGEIHKLLGDVIIWLAGIHALAAIYHHIRLKDKVLVSMLP